MRNLPKAVRITLAIVVALAGACADQTQVASEAGSGALVNPNADRHVDVTNITAQVNPPADFLKKESRGLVSSAKAFRRIFKTNAPAGVDFSRTWVIYASLGPKPSTGYGLDVRVRTHPTGNSLRAGVVTTAPGRGCLTGPAATSPYFVGTIPAGGGAGIAASSIRYYSKTEESDCGTEEAPVCGENLVAALGDAAIAPDGESVLAVSESDYPYRAISLGQAPEEISLSTVAKAALESGLFDGYLADASEHGLVLPGNGDKDAILAALLDGEDGGHEDYGTFSSSTGDFVRWTVEASEVDDSDEWAKNQSLGQLRMSETLRQNLTDIAMVYLFDVEVKLLIVGRSPCGELVGYVTTLIWT